MTGAYDGVAGELLRRLDQLRGFFAWKCSDLGSDDLRLTTAKSSLTLGGLLKHLALVEDDYFTVRLAGRPLPSPWSGIELGEVVEWAWRSAADDSAEELRGLWEAAVARSRAAVEEAMADGGFERPVALWPSSPPATLGRLVIDMIEEYARHCGHADLIRESVDGLVGEDPPRRASS